MDCIGCSLLHDAVRQSYVNRPVFSSLQIRPLSLVLLDWLLVTESLPVWIVLVAFCCTMQYDGYLLTALFSSPSQSDYSPHFYFLVHLSIAPVLHLCEKRGRLGPSLKLKLQKIDLVRLANLGLSNTVSNYTLSIYHPERFASNIYS